MSRKKLGLELLENELVEGDVLDDIPAGSICSLISIKPFSAKPSPPSLSDHFICRYCQIAAPPRNNLSLVLPQSTTHSPAPDAGTWSRRPRMPSRKSSSAAYSTGACRTPSTNTRTQGSRSSQLPLSHLHRRFTFSVAAYSYLETLDASGATTNDKFSKAIRQVAARTVLPAPYPFLPR